MQTPTPHNKAKKGDIAKIVLMPGDPLRSKRIAEKFLQNSLLVNNVRGVEGYTGEYNGKKISVMASGMGIPSIGIYATELYNAYDVDIIIRVGSCGSIKENMNLKDLVIATGACTNSSWGDQYGLNGTISAVADFDLLKKTDETVKKLNLQDKAKFGLILSTDSFYTEIPKSDLNWSKIGCLAVDMEAYGLYLIAQRCGKKALCICSVSDDLVKEKYLNTDERQDGFDEMIKLALEMVTI